MSILVQKYGGSSVASAPALRQVAHQVCRSRRAGHSLVVVVSAMGDTTDALLARVSELTPEPDRRELDRLLATGELASSAMLALALIELGERAISLSGSEAGILTNDVHGNARIVEVRPDRVLAELEKGRIVVVSGFQGVSPAGEVTTLGRGGSDTTAVALAAALEAERCEIYTDVEGVFTADPRQIAEARLLPALDPREMQELAWCGAQVLKAECVELARDHGVVLRVASSRGGEGTRIASPPTPGEASLTPRRAGVTAVEVTGVSGRRDLLRVVARKRGPGIDSPTDLDARLARLLSMLAPYDLVQGRYGDPVELLVSTAEAPELATLGRHLEEECGPGVELSGPLGAVALIGFGLGSRPAGLHRALRVLLAAGIPPLGSFSSRESLTFLVSPEQVDDGVRALHRAFVEAEPGSTDHVDLPQEVLAEDLSLGDP